MEFRVALTINTKSIETQSSPHIIHILQGIFAAVVWRTQISIRAWSWKSSLIERRPPEQPTTQLTTSTITLRQPTHSQNGLQSSYIYRGHSLTLSQLQYLFLSSLHQPAHHPATSVSTFPFLLYILLKYLRNVFQSNILILKRLPKYTFMPGIQLSNNKYYTQKDINL